MPTPPPPEHQREHGRAAVLTGVGGRIPDTIVTNDELSTYLDTSDEWIRTRTGIRERRVAAPGETTLHLAVEAGARAMKSAGVGEVDAVVLATTTPDRSIPGTAPAVASELGMTGLPALDVQAVCAGFVYAAATAAGLIATGTADSVLVVGSEVMSHAIDPTDRNTAVIFGDGAGAVVVRAGTADELGALGPFDLGSDGEGAELIAAIDLTENEDLLSPPRGIRHLRMDGREVYRRAIPAMADSSKAAILRRGWQVDDIDWLVGHQANVRILDGVARRLELPTARCYANIDRVGNTAAASIPLALAHAHEEGVLAAGDKIVLTAFGGGLSWGSTTLSWPALPAA